MGTAAGAAPHLHLATGSYQAAGAPFLVIKWTAGGEYLQGSVSKTTLEVGRSGIQV